jgi:hypothetical protein
MEDPLAASWQGRAAAADHSEAVRLALRVHGGSQVWSVSWQGPENAQNP